MIMREMCGIEEGNERLSAEPAKVAAGLGSVNGSLSGRPPRR